MVSGLEGLEGLFLHFLTWLKKVHCSLSYLRNIVKLRQRLRVRHKGKATATAHHMLYISIQLEGEVAKDRESGESSEERGQGVCYADDTRIPAEMGWMKRYIDES